MREEILDPELPIVDPHHHLWDFPAHRYLLPDLLADTGSGHNIESTVFIECTACYRADGASELRPLGETEFVNGIAAMCGERRLWADARGRRHRRAGRPDDRRRAPKRCWPPHGRGRPPLQGHPLRGGVGGQGATRSTIATPIHRRTFIATTPSSAKASPRWAGWDSASTPGSTIRRSPTSPHLARAFPAQPIVLDHVGGPLGLGWYADKRQEIFAGWKRDMRRAGDLPQRHVKLGGLGMRVNGFPSTTASAPPSSKDLADAWRPYVETCIEAFGAARCMFESNFPVDKISGSYAIYWNAFKRLAAGASAQEKAALFRDTAKRFYRLD